MNTLAFRVAQHWVAAAALCLLAGTAAATPQYHVSLQTDGYTGIGWLDLQFNPGFDGTPATAVLSNFSGMLGSDPVQAEGGVSGTLPGSLTFVNNTAFNDVFQSVQLGGVFGFDLDLTGTSSVFSVGLYGDDQMTALGNPDPLTNSLVAFNLGQDTEIADPQRVSVTTRAAVPEPASPWLLAVAFGALGFVRRRR